MKYIDCLYFLHAVIKADDFASILENRGISYL